MSAPTQEKEAKISGGQLAAAEPDGFLLYRGGEVAEDLKSELTRVLVDSQVTYLESFAGCRNLTELQLNEGLKVIGEEAFCFCSALRSVSVPSTVTELGRYTFSCCSNLAEVQLNVGLKTVRDYAFSGCTALRSVTIPSTVTKLGNGAFYGCTNLSEVILLGGQRLLNHEFLARHLAGHEGILKEEMVGLLSVVDGSTFHGCRLLNRVKISISWAVSERLARLTPECRLSVEEKIRNLPRLELLQDGNVLACFPLVSGGSDDEADDDSDTEDGDILGIQDTNNDTAESVYQVLQLKINIILNQITCYR